MNYSDNQPRAGLRPLDEKIDQLREQIRKLDPTNVATRIGAEYIPGEPSVLRIPWWDGRICLLFPELVPCPDEEFQPRSDILALLFYHILISRGDLPARRWISFSELPDGKFYAQAYQGYSGDLLKTRFGNDQNAFEAAAVSASGRKLPDLPGLPEAAYIFLPLPGLALLGVMWPGDEDFPASYQILFDASAPHQLPVDACAILGGMLARRIIKYA